MRVLSAVLGCGLLVGCSDSKPFVLPPPPSTAAPTPTEAPVDFSKIGLPKVGGVTTSTIVIGPGPMTLEGTVAGPEGPVEGATIRLERLVGNGTASVDLTSGPDGRWTAPNILGGRFRVRAWSAPTLAQVKPEIIFLSGSEPRRLALKLEDFSGVDAAAAIAPTPPKVGEATSLVVAVTNRSVGPDGVVRAEPVSRISVELRGSGAWRVESSTLVDTDSSGQARFSVRCQRSGSQPLAALIGGTKSVPLELPDCVTPPPSTSSTSRSPSSTGSTTTTR